MPGFLYFLEGQPIPIDEAIERNGLGYALDHEHTMLVECESASPSGATGYILGDNQVNSDTDIGYRRDVQEWRQFRNVWVGYYRESPPRPGLLARQETVRGYQITLADGNQWVVPLIRQQDGKSQLPHLMDVDEDGNWVRGSVVEKYRKLTEIASSFFEVWHGAYVAFLNSNPDPGEEFEFDYPGDANAATQILSCNYAISWREAAMLGLYADMAKHTALILWAACDCGQAANWIRGQKKTDSAGLSTDAGPGDSTIDTPRLLAS